MNDTTYWREEFRKKENAFKSACKEWDNERKHLIADLNKYRAENEKLLAERDLWISRFEDLRKNAARLKEARLKPIRLIGSAAAAALKETGDE